MIIIDKSDFKDNVNKCIQIRNSPDKCYYLVKDRNKSFKLNFKY
jgi:hypothetical protein